MNDKQSNQEAVIFQAKDESGVVRSYEVLITFTFQDTGENCMIYQEIEDTQNGQAKIFASLFDLKDN